MGVFTVWIVSPSHYPHNKTFLEIAQTLHEALIELGHDSRIVTSSFQCRGRTIVLGSNLLEMSGIEHLDLPINMIIYNMEQLSVESPWKTDFYLNLFKSKFGDSILTSGGSRKLEFWDYCNSNIDVIKKLRAETQADERIKIIHMPIGYMPCLTQIENKSAEQQDIDVLHYGSMNPRRQFILEQLKEKVINGKRLNVVHVFNCYGQDRDNLIARSKIVLNMHYYESKTFEIARCSYLMANKKCIVSETGNDEELEAPFRRVPFFSDEELYPVIAFADYSGLVDRVCDLLADTNARESIAQTGFETFSTMRQTDYLKEVL